MSSCLSGGGRAFRLDFDIIKSPTTSWTSTNSSSPSSTLSEPRNSPLSISTRKARTPRKRPNQIYNEAAAILSSAYPKLFPTKHLPKPRTFPDHPSPFLFEPSDLLMPFRMIDGPGCVLHCPQVVERSNFSIKPKGVNPLEKACQSPGEISSHVNDSSETCDDYREELDAESILDEEIQEGIDSIIGKLSMESNPIPDSNTCSGFQMSSCYGYPVGLGIDFRYGIRRELRAMRNGDEGDDWWRFPTVHAADITKKIAQIPVKKKNSEARSESAKENSSSKASTNESIPQPKAGLLLKLNYDNVLREWATKDSPFCDDYLMADSTANDVQLRLAEIDLFPEKREDGILVNKERRHTRHFSKKISCQVRKPKPDQRPRTKVRIMCEKAKLSQR